MTGVLEEECSQMMKEFFKELREKKKAAKNEEKKCEKIEKND